MKKIENRVESRTMILEWNRVEDFLLQTRLMNLEDGFSIFFSIKRDKSCAMTLGERESTIR